MTQKKVLLKIIILGDSGVGKTAIMHKYATNQFIEHHKPTIGADFSTKDIIIDDKSITLQLWDTAGQERFQSLGNAFYRGADACILVYDITNEQSFEKIESWRENFINQASPEKVDEFPFLLLGNKSDLAGSRKVNETNAKSYAQTNNMIFYETSALNGQHIDIAIRNIASNASQMDSVPFFSAPSLKELDNDDMMEKLDNQTPEKSSGCCSLL
eukprot:CAMPEP_0202694834 /NCGR_PEP_ID=MMETSP1385-20130828/8587_1 /ASSEMBLY_ACC=CAM_ASM_000861 /TAXON_ID=933848 /ORGANISM="Elphidium margaritaceum" /LENGTH=213 /DNA_ID=CAMNT_0049350745 /DNA_START=46 /DNA_END=687 /DNA_ORIENTATION=+